MLRTIARTCRRGGRKSMAKAKYDIEADALYVDLSSKKAYLTLEVSPRIMIDLDSSNAPVGIEILDASKALSKLFGTKIDKADLHRLHCKINAGEELYAEFQLGDREARLLIPRNYESPILRAS